MKYISRFVQLDFADPMIDASDNIEYIREAVEFAKCNLLSRHGILLEPPIITEFNRVVIEVKVPEDKNENFSIGKRLRGIPAYLLRTYPEKFHKQNNRVFFYRESDTIRKDDHSKISLWVRTNAMSKFATLLNRDDEESINKILEIIRILN